MSNDNNNESLQSNMPQPTMMDIYNLLTKCAQKTDIDEIKANIAAANKETSVQLEHLHGRIDICNAHTDANTDKITALEISVELLKQDQLKNNMCISGVPPNMVKNDNTADLVVQIAKALGLDYTASFFSSYSVAANKFIIVHFYNVKHKQMMMNKIRIKKSLMVEEAFSVTSNSQIYLNDHLTPYFNALYLQARTAKKENKLASASSYGGKIRARKRADDAPIVITSASQLQMLINTDNVSDMSHASINTSTGTVENASSSSHGNTHHRSNNNNSNRKNSTHGKGNSKASGSAKVSERRSRDQSKPTSKRKLNNSNNNNESNEKKARAGSSK